MNKPLADKLRPNKLDDLIGQKHLLEKGSVFRNFIENKNITNMIFYGPPGVGKTSVANIIANISNKSIYKLNGTTAKLDDIKAITDEIDSLINQNGILLYLDEIQYFNKKQQQILLDYIENGKITLIASTTENPYFYIYPALLSRCSVFEFKSLNKDDIKEGILKACNKINININDEAAKLIANSSNGDMRKALNSLEFIVNSLPMNTNEINLDVAKDFIDKASLMYDRHGDEHFDTLSAFHKSLRGSDPDAAIFYLAKLLEGGDLLAAARRLLCVASEDVGLAYPQGISITKACVDSALQLGMPEARIPLAEATIMLALAPKSNSSYLAIAKAMEDLEKGLGNGYPRHLQNKHYDSYEVKNKGQHYLYPHDFPNHYVKQQYLPNDIKNHKYYTPQENKFEQSLKDYWAKIFMNLK